MFEGTDPALELHRYDITYIRYISGCDTFEIYVTARMKIAFIIGTMLRTWAYSLLNSAYLRKIIDLPKLKNEVFIRFQNEDCRKLHFEKIEVKDCDCNLRHF